MTIINKTGAQISYIMPVYLYVDPVGSIYLQQCMRTRLRKDQHNASRASGGSGVMRCGAA